MKSCTRFLRKLVAHNVSDFPVEHEILDKDAVIKILWHFVASTRLQMPLAQRISMQGSAILTFSQNPSLGSHLVDGLGKFLHRFWFRVAETQRFALKSPDLFRSRLLDIRPTYGEETMAEVLFAAAHSVGVNLSKNVREQIQQWGE